MGPVSIQSLCAPKWDCFQTCRSLQPKKQATFMTAIFIRFTLIIISIPYYVQKYCLLINKLSIVSDRPPKKNTRTLNFKLICLCSMALSVSYSFKSQWFNFSMVLAVVSRDMIACSAAKRQPKNWNKINR